MNKIFRLILSLLCVLVLFPINVANADTFNMNNFSYDINKNYNPLDNKVTISVSIMADGGVIINEVVLPNGTITTDNPFNYVVAANGEQSFTVRGVDASSNNFEEEFKVQVNEIENKYLISFENNNPIDEYGFNSITNGITIDGSTLSSPLEGSYIILTIPTLVREANSLELDTDKFVDIFDVVVGDAVVNTEKIVDTVNKTTSYKINLKKLDGSTKITIPFNYSFTDRLTPDDYSLIPTVKAYNDVGILIGEASGPSSSPKYDSREAIKKVNGYKQDGLVMNAGTAVVGNVNYVDPNKAEYLAFTYDLSFGANGQLGNRLNKTTTIVDTLPTYIDNNGVLKSAYFNPALNPGWILSADGKTVEYTYNIDVTGFNGNLKSIDTKDELAKVVLYISFPGAPVKDGVNNIVYTNKADIISTSFNGSPAEKEIFSDDVSFNIAARANAGQGMISKYSATSIIYYDKFSLYTERLQYVVSVSNVFAYPINNLQVIEDASKYDSRLYITKVVSAIGENNADLSANYFVRAYKDDGTFTDFNLGDELNLNTQNLINSYAQQIDDGTLIPDNVPVINDVDFRKIVILKRDGTPLNPGEIIKFNILMAFKNPYTVPYSPARDIVNRAFVTGSYIDVNNINRSINVNSAFTKQFIPFNESVSLLKTTNQANDKTKIGDIFNSFTITVDFNSLSKARKLSNPVIIDLLPAGLNATINTKVLNHTNIAGLIESYDIINNYNNTGRQAIKIKLKSAKVSEYKSSSLVNPYKFQIVITNIQINSNAISSESETALNNNDNHVYLFEESDAATSIQNNPDVSSLQKKDDLVDIDMDGDINDKVIEATSKVKVQYPSVISSKKYIRSLEGATKNDPLDYSKIWSEEIITNYKSGVSGGRFQYKLEVLNGTTTPISGVEIYDVFPFNGDSRNSYFSNHLVSPITTLLEGGVDVSNEYDIYYSIDNNPPIDAGVGLTSLNWSNTVADYSKVTAIKIVMKHGENIASKNKLDIIIDMVAPEYINTDLSLKGAVNSFSVKYSGSATYGMTNEVKNILPAYRYINVEKLWVGSVGANAKVKLYRDNVEIDEKTIDASMNWKYQFEDLLLNDPNDNHIYNYQVKEVTDINYSTTVSGDMNTGFTIKNISKEKINIPFNVEWLGGILPNTTINLLLNGVIVDSITVDPNNAWQGIFKPYKYDLVSGNEIPLTNYSITQNHIDGFTVRFEGDATNGFKIINIKNISTPASQSKSNVNTKSHNTDIQSVPYTGSTDTILIYVIAIIISFSAILLIKFKK